MEEAWGLQLMNSAQPYALGVAIMTVAIKMFESIERIVRDHFRLRDHRHNFRCTLVAQVEAHLNRYEKHPVVGIEQPAREATANLLGHFSAQVDRDARAVLKCIVSGERGQPFIDCRDRLSQSLEAPLYKRKKRFSIGLRGPSAD